MAEIITMPTVKVWNGVEDSVRPTTVERMTASVHRHGITWTELTARVSDNEGIPPQEAAAQVCHLIEGKGCTLAVAIGIIDLIVAREHKPKCPVCNDSGFSGSGSGYGDVCSECGGQSRS